ncbi:MAG: hypothetical protein K940chlam8_00687 [Chlamydiae bacterium]|nr:hypothetical protein [Chlamydiota bacterium]
MKKCMFFLSLWSVVFCAIYIPSVNKHFDNELPPTLYEFLAHFDVQNKHEIHAIVKEIYPKWVREKGRELWQMPKFYVDNEVKLRRLLNELGLVDAILPKKSSYKYAVIIGGALPRIRNRIEYLAKLYKQGVRFKEIVVICCTRKLDPVYEPKKELLFPKNCSLPIKYHAIWHFPTQENELITLLFQMHELPPGMDLVPLKIVKTELLKESDGSILRPDVHSTAKQWVETHPKPGSVLLISSQPFCYFQHAILKEILPSSFEIETVGDHALDYGIEIYLDSIARWLYELSKSKRHFYFRSMGIRAFLSFTTKIEPTQISNTPIIAIKSRI